MRRRLLIIVAFAALVAIAASVPVVVIYRVEDGVAAAIRLEDAPGPSPA